jgi:hypothetical protein
VLAFLLTVVVEPGFEDDEIGCFDGDDGTVPVGTAGEVAGPGRVPADRPYAVGELDAVKCVGLVLARGCWGLGLGAAHVVGQSKRAQTMRVM